jgi:quercetin dioxygenase-like cupin family protein
MEKISLPVSFQDDRGKIIDLLENEMINAVTLINFKKNSVRANHYHKKTTQWNYLISGKINFFSQEPGKDVIETIMHKGDFIVSLPNDHHALKALEDSVLMVFTKGPRGGKEYESDTFRLEVPLAK